MDTLTQLESHSNDLATAVKNLASYSRNVNTPQNPTQPPLADPKAPEEVHRAAASIRSNISKIWALVCRPTDFLQHLAVQVCWFVTRGFILTLTVSE